MESIEKVDDQVMASLLIDERDDLKQAVRRWKCEAAHLDAELKRIQARLEEAEITAFNEGIEAAAQIFDRKEIFHHQVATWDRTQIVQGSKYNVPTNGPAIVCAGAEKQAKEIRALKKPFLAHAATLRKCLEIVEWVADEHTASDDKGQWCVVCNYWHDDYLPAGQQAHKIDCLSIKAKTLLSELKRWGKEGE